MKNRLTKIFMLICTLILLLCFSFGTVACNELEKEGKFYSLEKAYEDGLITREDLLNIAYYHGDAEHNPDEINDSFIPKELGELDEQTSLKIRTDLAEMYNEYELVNVKTTIDDFKIGKYLGAYSGCEVFFYSTDVIDRGEHMIVLKKVTIDGVNIVYVTGISITVWTER